MRKTLTYLLAVLPLTGWAAEPDSFAQLRKLFADPPAEYRTAPFLVWNGEVMEEDIDRFLTEYKDRGIGGVFIHPRPGLITPYLSERWFHLVRYAVEKGKRLGLKMWLYDENSYPSGFAGGHVPAEMPESWNEGQGLIMKVVKSAQPDTLKNCKYVLERSAGEVYCFELAFYEKRAWHGGFSYVDLIKPGVTEKFIELTMRGYERTIGAEFGKAVPGIFTDEPNIIVPVRKNCMRWTPDLFEQFQKRWGYDLKPHLPALFEERGDWRKVRHNYYALLLDLFIDRWAKPWYRYAESKKLAWTGHYWEHGWPSPAHGPDNMAMYAWHHVPGIDMLFNQYEETVNAQFGNVRSVKELASVANQTGRRRTLSETYGGAGWELRFEDMKRLGDWQAALGVNLMNQHLSFQTIVGARKHDYPQSFSYHTPWWDQYKVLADYFGRLSLALASGEQVNRILVLEPTSTAWMYASAGAPDARLNQVGSAFQDFITRLERMQGEYDLGCENIMRNTGKAARGALIVGKRSYELFVLPPGTENLDSPTVKLLDAYLAAGGKVLAFVDPPPFVDGASSDAVRRLAEKYASLWRRAKSLDEEDVKRALLPGDITAVSGHVFHQRRRLSDGELLFFANTSLESPAKATLRLKAAPVGRLDPLTGRIESFPARAEGGRAVVSVELPPAGSVLLFSGSAGALPAAPHPPSASLKPLSPAGALSVRTLQPNALTIDYCDLRIGEQLEPGLYYYEAAERAYKAHGFAGNPWNAAVQYKTTILDRNRFDPGSGFEAAFFFERDGAAAANGWKAVVERPEIWGVLLNGKPARRLPDQWWLDRAFGVYDISNAVPGRNELKLVARPMSVHHEIEPVYILGDFGLAPLQKGWRITAPAPLGLGSWKSQGRPFYSHAVSYSQTYRLKAGERYVVRLGKWSGTVAEVRVNGAPAGIIGWQPYEADVSSLVRDGENKIEVIVAGSLKNLLGPHHGKQRPGLVSPWSFRSAPKQMPPGGEYQLLDYGLLAPFEVLGR